jgi:hypothetical protein
MIRDTVLDTALTLINQGKSLEDIERELQLNTEEREVVQTAQELKNKIDTITPSEELSAELLKNSASNPVIMHESARYNLYERIKQRLGRFSL